MATDFNETPGAARYKKTGGSSLGQMWKNPIFKLVSFVIIGGGVAFAGMQFLSKPPKEAETVLPTVQSTATASPTTEVTPEYQRAVQQLDEQRAAGARDRGVSAIPTPMQNPVAAPTVDVDATTQGVADPLRDFENIISNGRNTADTNQVTAVPQPAAPPVSPEAMQALTKTMRQQMDALMGQWGPVPMQVVVSTSSSRERASTDNSSDRGGSAGNNNVEPRLIIQAGSVYYGQMLMEANSDIPGPVMAQILTGPFAGGRAIGSFETYRNHLAIHFKTVAIRNRQFTVDILALDPDTTLGGVVTEVDPRYFSRVLLPAAAAFVKAFGETISTPPSTTTVTGSGGSSITTNEGNDPTTKDALYAGMGEAADRVGDFVDQEGASIKRLVRVAVGTPVGLFFVSPVTDEGQ